MEIITETKHNIPPEQLANALIGATPEEFSQFWFIFYSNCNQEKLRAFAENMSSDLGLGRKKILFELCDLIKYYENKHKLEKND